MVNVPQSLNALWPRGKPCPFDDVLDVRSPGEYALDHMPGAINVPVLSDAERVEVGTIYAQNPFEGRRRGAAYASINISGHLGNFLRDKPKSYAPLIYCFRGGQRSASLAHVMAQVGWRVTVLRRGYRSYRTHVVEQMVTVPRLFRFKVLAGATGTAKTKLLHELATQGDQVLDLEALAGHRGSILGHIGPQPSQKFFESHLLAALNAMDATNPVWVEAESHRIGNILLPPAITSAMKTSEVVEVRMPLAARVRHLLAEYESLTRDTGALKQHLRRLESRIGAGTLAEWDLLIDAGNWPAFVASLLAKHYDPAYSHAARKHFGPVVSTVEISAAAEDNLKRIVQKLRMSGLTDHSHIDG